MANSTIRTPFFAARPIEHHEADLAVDVERDPEEQHADHRSEHAHGHGQHDDERAHEALELRREDEVRDDESKNEHEHDRPARFL